MLPITLKTGEYEIINSGVFHAIEDEKTVMSLGGTDITILFEKTEDGKQTIEFKTVDTKKAEIKLINVQGSLGYGTTKPFPIGEVDGKKLYLTFVTRALNDTYLRTFEFTLYKK